MLSVNFPDEYDQIFKMLERFLEKEMKASHKSIAFLIVIPKSGMKFEIFKGLNCRWVGPIQSYPQKNVFYLHMVGMSNGSGHNLTSIFLTLVRWI